MPAHGSVSTTLKGVAVIAATSVGAPFGIGFLLAALLEVQSFGDGDSTPSNWRLVEYGAGFVGCVTNPALLSRKLIPGRGLTGLVAFAVATAGVLVILGLSLKA